MAKKTGLSVLSEKIGGKLVSGGASSSSSSNGKSYSRETTSSSGRRSSGLESLSEKIGATAVTEKRPKGLTDWYLDTLNNQTFLPHNTHMDELNAHMMEEGLHPIYTNDERSTHLNGRWAYDEKTNSFYAKEPEKNASGRFVNAKEGEDYIDDQISGLTARREYLQGRRKSIPSEVSPYQQWETENPGDKAWQKEFDLLLKLQSGEITEAEYDAGVKAIKETHPENVLDRTLKEYRDAGSEIERLDAQEKILQDYKKYYGIMQMDGAVQKMFAELYDANTNEDTGIKLAVREGLSGEYNPSGSAQIGATAASQGRNLTNEYLQTSPERIERAKNGLRKAGFTDEQIEELYSAYANVMNDEWSEYKKGEFAQWAEAHPVIASVDSVILGMGGGMESLLGAVLRPGQRNTSFTDAQTISSAIRETVNNKIETTVKEKTGSKFLATVATWGYDALTSSAESAIAMSVGGAGEVFLGLNAAMEQYNEALNNGWSTGRALTSAVFTGAFESLFEHLSLENLRALKTQGQKGAVNRLKDLIKSFITEGSEEFFTDVANEAYDYFFNGGLSAYEVFASDYREQNPTASDSEIAGQYAKKFGEQITQSFIVGGLSGVMGAGRTQALQSINAVGENIETGRGLRELSALTGQSERSLVSPVEDSLSYGSKAQQRIEERLSSVTPQGSQSSEVRAEGANHNKGTAEKTGLFRRVTDWTKQVNEDRRKGKAVNEALLELKEADRQTLQEMLHAKGYGERNAKSTSWDLLNLLNGESENEKDAERLLRKQGVEEVVKEFLQATGVSDTEEYKRTRAAAELLRSLDIARGEGSAEDKLRRIRWVSETYDLQPEEAIQYFADEATKDVTAEAKKLTRDGKDLSGVVKRAYKAQITVDGKALDVEIKGVAGVEDGDLLLKTEKDGETVKLSEVDFDAFEGGDVSQAIFEDIRTAMTGTEFKTKMSADAANVLLGIIETQPLSAGTLIEDFYRYYAAGKAGRSFESVEKTYDATDLANRSSKAVREAAFEAGQREYEVKPGLTRIGGTQTVTETQVDEMFVIDSWAKSIGKSFFVVDGLFSDYVSERGIKHRLALTNGLRNDNCILLSLKTGDLFGVEGQHWTRNLLLVTAVHETVHEIKARDVNAYNQLKDMALRALGAREGKDGLNRIYNRFYETYKDEIDPGATQKEVFEFLSEEVTAQYFGVAITRGSIDEFLKADGEETVSTEKIGFLEKLKEIFKRIAAALQKKLEELAKKDLVAASVMQADVKELQKAVETFDAVLESVKDLSAARTGSAAASAVRAEGADQNKNTAEGAVEKSLAYSYAELLKKGPVSVVDCASLPDEAVQKYLANRDLMAKDAREVARQVSHPRNTANDTYLYFPDLGMDVKITKNSYKHGAERIDASYVNLAFSLPDIVKYAVCVNELNATADSESGYVLLGIAEQSDHFSIVRLVVNDKQWKLDQFEELYAFKKTDIKKEGVGSKAPALPSFKKGYDSPSTISINDFLSFVNSQNLGNAVLSKDVLEKLNSGRRVNEKLTQSLKYSYAGRASEMADQSLLETAARMEEEGRSSEEIRKETGWFRGMDGQWRYEIDDSKMKIDLTGAYMFNPDVRRLKALQLRLYTADDFSNEEAEELRGLEKTLKGVRKKPQYLGEILRHKELFAAYPALEKVRVSFEDLGRTLGAWDEDALTMRLNEKYLKNEAGLKETLLHEIQHILQTYEGFTQGASPDYWIERKYGKTASEIKREEAAQARIQNARADFENRFGEDARRDLDRYWRETMFMKHSGRLNNLSSEEIEWMQSFENRDLGPEWSRLLEEWKSAWADFDKVQEDIERRHNESAYLTYWRTAGEIEARDAEGRADLTAEQRKENRPDIDRTDVVFADGSGVSYAIGVSDEGQLVAVVTNNILAGMNLTKLTDAKDFAARVAAMEAIRQIGPYILVGNLHIAQNQTTRHHYIESKYTQKLRKQKDLQKYIDKLKIASVYGDAVRVATNLEPDNGLSHERNDNFVDFLHGNTLLYCEGRGYEAEVVVGITDQGQLVLYDLVNMNPKNIKIKEILPQADSSQKVTTPNEQKDLTGNIAQETGESQEKKSLAGDAEALAYAAEMREGNAINRARIDTLEEAARDIGAYEEGELTDAQARTLARKYNLSGDETQRKEIAVRLREIRAALIGGQSLDKALYDLYTIAKREASAAGHWEDVESGSKEGKAFVKGAKIFVDEQTLTNIAEKYGGRAALRRATFGKFTLTPTAENGTSGSLDAFYSEALEQHLGLEETTDPDVMVENLLSFWARSDRIWVEDEGFFGEGQTLEEAATDVAVQMLRDLLYAGRKPTETEKERLARLDVLGEELKKQREAGIHDALTASNEEYQKKLAELQESDLDMLEVERQAERLKAEQRIEALRTAYEARIDAERQNVRDQVARQQLTRDIHRNMSSLGKLIVNGRDADHIPEELRSSILAFAKLFGTNDRNVFTKAMARDLETVYGYIGKEYTEDGEQNPLFAGYDEDIAESIRQLASIPMAGNGQILTGLLGLDDLRTLATVSEHILAIVKRANSTFIDGRRVRLDGLGDAIIHDAETKERSRLARKMSGRGPYDYLTGDMLTPIWFFKEKVGGTMGEIYEGFRNAQDEWFRKVSRGRDAVQAAKEAYHYKEWKDGKTHFYFTDAFGNVFDHDLTVEQMLQIYATYMRERQNGMESLHLTTGGIVLEEEVQTLGDRIKRLTEKKKGSNEEKTKALSEELERRAYNQRFQISVEQIEEVVNSLTQEQRDYADAVVKFMSGDVSNWGNDATMRRYGYAKFKEKYYFPFQSSENYLYSKLGTTNDARLKAAGFSKKLVHGAKTPLVISSFSDVAASHIQEMAMYSAFLNPLEDFNQVWSYENKETGKSVKSEIGAVYGSRAQDYVSRFITDVNGGMRSDRIDNIWNKGTSLFKKAAVMANASVVIQQPTALMRAMALINPKYFVGAFRLADYRNMMEHSEVAGIKEMGGFDTGLGASATEWMLDEKSVSEKISDAAGKGAELADAVTWTNLWNAVRRETKAKNKDRGEDWIGSEEYYEECRKRFRDIVDYTQVYDSTLSKSALMRSKSALTRMVTAFMAEPTLSFNLITQSGKNRTIHKGRALFAFVANVVINAAFQSIVGAWRKPDEDETYTEKWLEKFASNLLGDAKVGFLDSSLSPLTMIPWIKDLLSIWEGYDVSRSDVSVFSDLISAVQSIAKEIEKNGRPGFQSVLDLAGVISAFTPIPIRRATQDVQGLIRQSTEWKDGLVHNSLEGARDAFLAGIGLEKGKTEGAYQAVLFKDEEYIRRQLIPDKAKIAKYEAEGYSHEDSVKKAEDAAKTTWHTNVRAGLIEQDERVLQAAESKVGYRFDEFEALVEEIVADGFERNDVLKSVEKLVEELRKAGETPEYEEKEEKDEELYAQKDLIPAWDDRDLVNFSKAWDRLEEQGIETKKLVSYSKKFLTEALENGEIGVAERLKTLLIGKGAEEKTVNGYARDYAEIYFDESGMNRPKTLEILMKLAGMEREEAESKLDYWGYKIGNPDGTLTQDQYGKYLEEVKPSGIGVNVYETYVNLRKTATGTDLDGDGKTDSGSVKRVVLQQIDSLPISNEQKDVLYRLNGWSEKTINEAPWR